MAIRSPFTSPIGGYTVKPAPQSMTVGATVKATSSVAARGGGSFSTNGTTTH